MSIINRYAMIDHVGSLEWTDEFMGHRVVKKTLSEDSNKALNRVVYGVVNKMIKDDGFEKSTSVKAEAQAESPFAREITSKMKTRIRHIKNPTKVYLICNNAEDNNVKYAEKIWTDRGIDVQLIEVNPFTKTHQLDDGIMNKKRRIAEIWASAIGWTFSAPITRIQAENSLDNYSKRPDHDERVARNELHITKVMSRAESYLEHQRCIAPDEEIDAFIEHYLYLHKTKLLPQFLEPDYVICEHCGKPRNIHNHKDRFQNIIANAVCPHCEAEYDDDDIIVTTYYDDSYREDEDPLD